MAIQPDPTPSNNDDMAAVNQWLDDPATERRWKEEQKAEKAEGSADPELEKANDDFLGVESRQ
jgi:hypothetical protein